MNFLLLLMLLYQPPTVASPPGTYTVQTFGETTITVGDNWIKFQWGGNPTPVPVPPKATGRLFITLIYDKNVDQNTVLLRNQLATTDLKVYDTRFRSFRFEQKDMLQSTGLDKHIKAVPCIIVQEMGKDGKSAPVRSDGVFNNPKSFEQIINYIKSLRNL